jgi:hypothetical protein
LAELLGSELPDELFQKIRLGSQKSTREVVVLCTIDDMDFPNISLLSFLDIRVVSRRRLIFAIGASSSTKRNLLRTRRATIAIWLGRDLGMYYVKGATRQICDKLNSEQEGRACSAISFSVKRVSKDFLADAKMLSTLTYDTKRVIAQQRRVFRELSKLRTNT